MDHRLAWIIAVALVGTAACSSGNEAGTTGAPGGRDGGAKELSKCLGPSWFGVMKDDCRGKMIGLACGDMQASGAASGGGMGPSCQGVFKARSDAEIAGILAALDEGQLAEDKLADQNASSPAVKAFAQTLSAEHTTSRDGRRQMLKQKRLRSADGDVSRALTKGFDDAAKSLGAVKGADFDKEFVGRQIVQHANTVDMLEELAPMAKSSDLRSAVEQARDLEKAHQKLGCTAWSGLAGMPATRSDDAAEETPGDACEAAP